MDEFVVGRVFDLCDDSEAFEAANERGLWPDEEPAEEELLQVAMLRAGTEGLSCGPGGRRFMCISRSYWHEVTATRQESEGVCKAEAEAWIQSLDNGLGFLGPFSWPRLGWPAGVGDDVAVLRDTVSVVGGTVRGLVTNRSKTLFARDVMVSVPADAGGGTWSWPLTVQPGERVPFEIDGWSGSADPAAVDVRVTANLSPYVDVSRSFGARGMGMGVSWGDAESYREYADLLPFLEQLNPATASSATFETFFYKLGLQEPDSHPSLADAVWDQTVEDLRAYVAFLDDNGKIVEVVRVAPMRSSARFDESIHRGYAYVPVTKLPMDLPMEPSVGEYHFSFDLWFILEQDDFYLWVGGANPPPDDPPVLEPTDPPPRTPRVPVPGD